MGARHMVKVLGSDFDSGSVFPAEYPCDRGPKNAHRGHVSDAQNGIRRGVIDPAMTVLAGAATYT